MSNIRALVLLSPTIPYNIHIFHFRFSNKMLKSELNKFYWLLSIVKKNSFCPSKQSNVSKPHLFSTLKADAKTGFIILSLEIQYYHRWCCSNLLHTCSIPCLKVIQADFKCKLSSFNAEALSHVLRDRRHFLKCEQYIYWLTEEL